MIQKLKKQVIVKGKSIGDGNTPYIIAEMACAHNGSFEDAKLLIDKSVEAGADATQLQFFNIDEVVTPINDLKPILEDVCFSENDWTKLFNYAKSKNIDVWACTYDVPSVKLAVKLGVDGIKLNSADLSNPEVVKEVSKSKIPFTLGSGASSLEEINAGLNTAIESGAEEIILMHGVQNFPTQIEDLNISKIELLKEVFKIPVGYHDHVDGDNEFGKWVDLIALGLGANVIEKHICLDRSKKGLDYQAALEPKEFKNFVQRINLAFSAYGNKIPKPFSESELKYRKFQKKSIIAFRDIKKGEKITRKDVFFSRNSEPGIPPIEFNKVDGKIANTDITKYSNIDTNMLQ